MSKNTVFEKLDTSDMHGRSKRGMVVTMSAQGARFCLQIGSTVVLGRLLTPSDYGLVGMAAVVINLVAMFKDAGLAQATVQREVVTPAQISTLFWINLGLVLVLALLVGASAPLIAWIYGDSRLVGLTVVLTVPIIASGLSIQHRALLERNMRFIDIARAEVLGMAFGVTVGIFCALHGAAYWSLVIMQIAMAFSTTLILWALFPWRPRRWQRGSGVRSMLKFGANLTGFNFINYFARNADKFLLGKFYGAQAIGQYSLAYRFLMLPLSQINAPISRVLLPTLSRIQNDQEAYSELFLKYVQRIGWLTIIPISLGTLIGGPLIVLLLGEQWREAGGLFEILTIAALFQPVSNLTGLLYTSRGLTNRLLQWGLVGSSITVIGFIVGLNWGTRGVAIAYASTSLLITIPCWWWACRCCNISLGSVFRKLLLPSLGGLLVAGASVFLV